MIRIILIGYMGAGKTTVGKELAKALGLTFYDMLHEVAEFENVVISCGGGTPCFFDNMEYMNQQADTIYLKASPEILQYHLSIGKGVRPLLLGKSKEEVQAFIRQQLGEREHFYSQARHTINVDRMDNFEKISITVDEIRQMLGV